MSNLGRWPDGTGYGPGFPAVHCPECEHLRAELAEARGDIKALRTERTELYLEQERLREKLAHSRLDELKEKFYAARAGGE